jgi:hypothetical protein
MTTDPRNDRRLVAAVALASAVVAAACGSTSKPDAKATAPAATAPVKTEVLTVQRIQQMIEQGNSFQDIIGAIQQTGTVYNLTDAQQQKLRGSGFTATLLSFMELTYNHAVEVNPALAKSKDQWHQVDGYWYGGRPFGWPEAWVTGAPRFGERFRSQ